MEGEDRMTVEVDTENRRSPRAFALVLLLAFAAGCGDREDRELVRVEQEREAIEILDILRDGLSARDLVAEKKAVKDGQKTVWQIMILECTRPDLDTAFRELVRANRPKVRYPGLEEMLAGGKLIPSETEDRARYIHAREGEVQNALLALPGVVDAEVNLALPREPRGAEAKDKTPASASVVLKFRDAAFAQPFVVESTEPVAADAPFVPRTSKDQVRQAVASGVEGLDPRRVTVMVTVEGSRGVFGSDDPGGAAPGSAPAPDSIVSNPSFAAIVEKLETDFRTNPGEALRRLETDPAAEPKTSSGSREFQYLLGMIALGIATVVTLISLLKAKAALRKALRR
jgi:type III secretory pathway lipoprotein EscJ